jgi:hypothetical protein
MLLNKRFGLKVRNGHFYTGCFGFVAAGNNTAIIIAQYHYRLLLQIGSEQPLARTIEAVAINNCFHNKLFVVGFWQSRKAGLPCAHRMV